MSFMFLFLPLLEKVRSLLSPAEKRAIIERHWSAGTARPTFSILQWNVLVDKYCSNDDRGFPYVTAESLDLGARRHLFQDFFRNNRFSFVALEEVEDVQFFESLLEQCGMQVHFFGGDKFFSNALAWATSSTKSVLCEDVRLPHNGSAIVGSFEASENLKIGVTHLKAKQGNEQLRLEQISALLRLHPDLDVLVGDFNDTPDSLCVNAVIAAGFKHAYDRRQYSTTKKRPREGLVCRKIDYIFYKDHLQPSSILLVPPRTEIPDVGLPCPSFPSDHFSLAAKFSAT